MNLKAVLPAMGAALTGGLLAIASSQAAAEPLRVPVTAAPDNAERGLFARHGIDDKVEIARRSDKRL